MMREAYQEFSALASAKEFVKGSRPHKTLLWITQEAGKWMYAWPNYHIVIWGQSRIKQVDLFDILYPSMTYPSKLSVQASFYFSHEKTS